MLPLIALLLTTPLPPAERLLPAAAPVLHADDSWRFKNATELQGRFSESHDEATVVRVQGDAVDLRIHAVDSTLQPSEVLVGSDWSRFRSVNGKETVVNRPFAFPLAPGKTWTVDFGEEHPNRLHAREHVTVHYAVAGIDRVTVPAGSFDAVKVEGNGTWTAVAAPSVTGGAIVRTDAQGAAVVNQIDRQTGGEASGRIYMAFWYVPGVRHAVKTVEEWYNGNGVRYESRVSEMESYKLAD